LNNNLTKKKEKEIVNNTEVVGPLSNSSPLVLKKIIQPNLANKVLFRKPLKPKAILQPNP